MKERGTHAAIAIGGFTLSALLTWWFIDSYDGYMSAEHMLLSGGVAGGKWAIQLGLGWFLLAEKRWLYFRELGIVCALGSLVLLPYAVFSGGWGFFLGSLVACVIAMGGLICWRLPKIGLKKSWVFLWFGLLAVAVSLQLTAVFDVV